MKEAINVVANYTALKRDAAKILDKNVHVTKIVAPKTERRAFVHAPKGTKM